MIRPRPHRSCTVIALVLLLMASAGSTTATGGDAVPAAASAPAAKAKEKDNIPRPVWAAASGVDRCGTWADLKLAGVSQRMRLIPAGTFTMGCSPDEAQAALELFKAQAQPGQPIPDIGWFLQAPQHEVTLTSAFWLSDTPVTQELWEAVVGSNPSANHGKLNPVEMVSWQDCQGFFAKLNAHGAQFGFPTEAQWEYACRAGTTTMTYGPLDEIAWYVRNCGRTTHPVRTKKPNAWGLFDMLGNVMQHTQDTDGPYPTTSVTDPTGAATGPRKVARGAGYIGADYLNRASYRATGMEDCRWGNLGLRICAPFDAADNKPAR